MTVREEVSLHLLLPVKLSAYSHILHIDIKEVHILNMIHSTLTCELNASTFASCEKVRL